MEDIRQTTTYARYLNLLGWDVDTLKGIYIYSKRLPLIGYFSKIQRPPKIDLDVLNTFVAKKHPFYIAIEPLNNEQEQFLLKNLHYQPTKSSSLPSKTLRIDLRKNITVLLKEMHYKTRYNIKIAVKHGVTVKQSGDIEIFSKLWHQCAKKRGLWLSLHKEISSIYQAFAKNAQVFLAEDHHQLLAGILLLLTPNGAYYMYAAATSEGKKKFAPSLLAWKTILYAKEQGKQYYDFEGLYDERFPIKAWQGFSRFKQSFGGEAVYYPGISRKFFNPYKL